MNSFTLGTIAGGAFAALAMGFPAIAQAAPSGIGSAQAAVNELEHSGFKVVLNKVGTAPLENCTVDSVLPGETVTHAVKSGTEVVSRVVYQTVYLTAKC